MGTSETNDFHNYLVYSFVFGSFLREGKEVTQVTLCDSLAKLRVLKSYLMLF